MTDREIFRRNLTNMLNETKTRQTDLAKYAEVSYQTVSAWVKGRGYPRADAMERICRFFGVKQSALTEDTKKEQTPEEELILAFRTLPVEGKQKLLDRAEELLKLYPKKGRKPYGKAKEK